MSRVYIAKKRELTVTRYVKKLIAAGEHDPMQVAEKVIAALRSGTRLPKSWFIVYNLIKDILMELHFAPLGYKSWTDVKHAGTKSLTLEQLAACAPELPIPLGKHTNIPTGRPRGRPRKQLKV